MTSGNSMVKSKVYNLVNYLVHHLPPDDILVMIKAVPFQFINHLSHTTCKVVVIHCKSCCSSLTDSNFMFNIKFHIGAQEWST